MLFMIGRAMPAPIMTPIPKMMHIMPVKKGIFISVIKNAFP